MTAHYGDMELGRKDEEGVRAFYREIPSGGGRENTIGPVVLREEARNWKTRVRATEEDTTGPRLDLRRSRVGGSTGCRAMIRTKPPTMSRLGVSLSSIGRSSQRGNTTFVRGSSAFLTRTTEARGRDGRWARPDLTLLGGKVLPYLPGKFLDVITFEVKLGMPVEGLYEALAHRRRANFAYVICIYPEHWGPPDPTEQATIVAEATRQGSRCHAWFGRRTISDVGANWWNRFGTKLIRSICMTFLRPIVTEAIVCQSCGIGWRGTRPIYRL